MKRNFIYLHRYRRKIGLPVFQDWLTECRFEQVAHDILQPPGGISHIVDRWDAEYGENLRAMSQVLWN